MQDQTCLFKRGSSSTKRGSHQLVTVDTHTHEDTCTQILTDMCIYVTEDICGVPVDN